MRSFATGLLILLLSGCGGGAPTVPGPQPASPPKTDPVAEPFPEPIATAWTKAGATVGWMRFEPKFNMLMFVQKDQFQKGDVPALHFIGSSIKGYPHPASTIKDLPRPEIPFGLVLQGVAFTDELMPDVAAFQHLQFLRFNLAIKLTGEGLKHLRGLKNLQILDLGGYSNTPVTDGVLAALAANDQLHLLTLARGPEGARPKSPSDVVSVALAGPTDAAFQSLKGFKNLESILAGGPEITDAGLEALAGFEKLRELDLTRASVTNDGLKHLGGLKTLRMLGLGGTKVTDDGLKHLVGLTSLESLGLGGTKVTDDGLKHLGGLKSLESLVLSETKLTGAGLKDLKGLPKLKTLFLDQTQIADAELSQLSGLTKLQTLSLTRTTVTDAGVKRLMASTNLKSLNLEGTRITDAGLKGLDKLEQLETLGLSLTMITDAALDDIQKLKKLKRLDLSMTVKTTELRVKQLREALPGCQISWGFPKY